MPIDLTKTSLEPQHNQALLKDLQGNILNGHDRDHAIHIFIKFHLGSAKATKDWLQTFAEKITSAWQQWEETSTLSNNSASNNSASEKCFTSFLLSAHGYESLGFDLKPTDNENNVLFDDAFRAGMRVFRNWLSDPAIEEWEQNYQNQIDAVIILANNDLANLRQETEQLKLAINQVAEIITIETGRVLKNEHGQIIENFGFVDGISQPLFMKSDIDLATAQGIDKWDPSAPLKLVLVKDPYGQGESSFGSYCVYRKLAQDVVDFENRVKQLAQQIEGDNAKELAGALVVGRFKDGTPVTLNSTAQSDQVILNNFNYDNDPNGLQCPFQAHARNINPRSCETRAEESLEKQRQHRIVRRGITYASEQTKEVGLLFFCFQSDIINQFLFLQRMWANDQHFVKYKTGLDALIGQGKQQDDGQKWPKKWGQSDTVQFDFSHFITMKGGEFLFAPSISFLKNITNITTEIIL